MSIYKAERSIKERRDLRWNILTKNEKKIPWNDVLQFILPVVCFLEGLKSINIGSWPAYSSNELYYCFYFINYTNWYISFWWTFSKCIKLNYLHMNWNQFYHRTNEVFLILKILRLYKKHIFIGFYFLKKSVIQLHNVFFAI